MNKKSKILFVDDNREWRNLTKMFLGEKYDLELAKNGKEALEIIKSKDDISIVITDTQMPVMTGKELVSELKREYPQLPIIMISGWEGYKKWAQKQNVIFISKDDFVELPKIISNMIMD